MVMFLVIVKFWDGYLVEVVFYMSLMLGRFGEFVERIFFYMCLEYDYVYKVIYLYIKVFFNFFFVFQKLVVDVMYIFFYVIVLFWFCIGIFLYYVGGVVGYLLNFKL